MAAVAVVASAGEAEPRPKDRSRCAELGMEWMRDGVSGLLLFDASDAGDESAASISLRYSLASANASSDDAGWCDGAPQKHQR